VYVPNNLRIRVSLRASFSCEYCGRSLTFNGIASQLDHIRPVSRNGQCTFENLAMSCGHCNWRKRDCEDAVDPETRKRVRLFNPRVDDWNTHFQRNPSGRIVGRDSVGIHHGYAFDTVTDIPVTVLLK